MWEFGVRLGLAGAESDGNYADILDSCTECAYSISGRGMCRLHGRMRRRVRGRTRRQMAFRARRKTLFPRNSSPTACRYSAGAGFGT